jgi:hypothetical protein
MSQKEHSLRAARLGRFPGITVSAVVHLHKTLFTIWSPMHAQSTSKAEEGRMRCAVSRDGTRNGPWGWQELEILGLGFLGRVFDVRGPACGWSPYGPSGTD